MKPSICDKPKCIRMAVCIVHWPGTVLRLCSACRVEAHDLAKRLGFPFRVGFELEQLATSGLSIVKGGRA